MILASISKREKEVLNLISRGMTDKEIGEHLQISAYTANDHRKNLINKFGTRNACAMVRKAFELALLPLFSTPDMRLQTSIEKHRVHYI